MIKTKKEQGGRKRKSVGWYYPHAENNVHYTVATQFTTGLGKTRRPAHNRLWHNKKDSDINTKNTEDATL